MAGLGTERKSCLIIRGTLSSVDTVNKCQSRAQSSLCVIFTEIFLLVLKCVEITLTDDTACSLYKRFKDKQRQCNSVTGSQYFVARECRNNLIILSRVPDPRQSGRDDGQ